MVPFSLVALLIVLYIILIGPVDYLLVKKVLRRMEWTWITFPAIVIGVSVAGYALAYWLKGSQLRVNQVDVVDVDVAGGQVRGSTWLSMFSPRTQTYDLTVRPRQWDGQPAEDAEVLFSWLGLPGDALGGMGSTGGGLSMFDGYNFAPSLDRVQDMPVQVWSTKSLTARWSFPAASPVTGSLERTGDGKLRGTLTSRMETPLRNATIVYGSSVYRLGTIGHGDEITVDPTNRTDESIREFNAAGDAVSRAIREMMFHDLAGGDRPERPINRYQHFIDFSGKLSGGRTGEAILVAESPAASGGTAQLLDGEQVLDGGGGHGTIYRFVFPVQPAED